MFFIFNIMLILLIKVSYPFLKDKTHLGGGKRQPLHTGSPEGLGQMPNLKSTKHVDSLGKLPCILGNLETIKKLVQCSTTRIKTTLPLFNRNFDLKKKKKDSLPQQLGI